MSFLAPLFLLGLVALAIPVWLHLMNRSDPPAQPFSSTFLLKHSEQITSSQRSVRYWLLLSLRLLALLILVLLFAQPAIQRLQSDVSGPGDKQILILLDRSLSMDASDRWQQAQQLLADLLEDQPAGTSAQLVAASGRYEVIQESTTDLSAVRTAIQRVRPDSSELNLGALVQAADDLVVALGGEVEIHLISDLQASNLPPRFTDLVPSRAPMIIHAVQSDQANLTLTAQWQGQAIAAQIQSDRPGVVAPGEVELRIDGDLAARVDAQPSGDQLWTVRFELPELPLDSREIELGFAADDALAADNHFYLAPPTNNQVSALVLAATATLNDALYLRTALESLSSPRVAVDVQYAGGSANLALDDYQLVLVQDAGVLSDGLTSALESWVARGGNLMLVAGSRVANGETIPLSAGRLQANASDAQPGLLINDLRHAAFSRFPANSLSAELYRPRQLTGFEGRVLVQTSSGLPFMVEQSRGAGRILLIAHGMTPDATNLSLQPDFVPLIRSLVSWMAEINRLPSTLTTGDSLLLGTVDAADRTGAPVVQQLFLTDGSPLLGLSQQGQRQSFRIPQPGVYGLQTASGLYRAAANLPLAEIGLRPIEPSQLETWQRLAAAATNRITDSVEAGESQRLLPEWKTWEAWLLPLLLGLLIAEALFANAHLKVRREA